MVVRVVWFGDTSGLNTPDLGTTERLFEFENANIAIAKNNFARAYNIPLEKIAVFDTKFTTNILSKSNRAVAAYLKETTGPIPSILRKEKNGNLARWLFYAGFVFDLSIRRALMQKGILHEQPEDYWIWIFSGLITEMMPFGIRAWRSSMGNTIARVWQEHEECKEIAITEDDANIIIQNYQRDESIVLGAHASRLASLKLKHLGLIKKEKGNCPAIPVLTAQNSLELIDLANEAADRIIDGGVITFLDDISAEIHELSKIGIGYHCAIHASVRLLMERAAWEFFSDLGNPNFIKVPHHEKCWAMDNEVSNYFLTGLACRKTAYE